MADTKVLGAFAPETNDALLDTIQPGVVSQIVEKYWPQFTGLLAAVSIGMAGMAPKSAEAAGPSAPSVSQEVGGTTLAASLAWKWFSEKFAREVDRLSRQEQERIARGEPQNTVQNVFWYEEGIEPSIRSLVNNGGLVEREDEKQLGLPPILDESTYIETLDKLFDPTNRKKWLRNTNGTELTEKALARDTERITSSKKDYVDRLAEFKKSPKGAEIISAFFFLYNEGKKNITSPSTEWYRRLLVAALSIASSLYSSSDNLQKNALAISAQSGEYILITNYKENTIVKLGIWVLKSFFFSPTAFQDHPVLAQLRKDILEKNPSMAAAWDTMENISEQALTGVQKDNERIIAAAKEAEKGKQLDAAIATSRENIARNEQKAAGLEQKAAEYTQETADAQRATAAAKREQQLGSELRALSDDMVALVKEFLKKRDPAMKTKINAVAKRIDEIYKESSDLAVKYGYSEGFKKSVTDLYNITMAWYKQAA